METESGKILEMKEERKVADNNDDVVKRLKQSKPLTENSYSPSQSDSRTDEDVSDMDTFKRKKQQGLTGEGGIKIDEVRLRSPHGVRQPRKNRDTSKIKSKRTQVSHMRQRYKSLGSSPDKPNSNKARTLLVGSAVGSGDDPYPGVPPSAGDVLSRALSAPATPHVFPPQTHQHLEADHDMLDHMSFYEVSDNDMSDRDAVSDHVVSEVEDAVSDHAMSDREVSDHEMLNNKNPQSDQELMSDAEGSVRQNLAGKLLNLKIKHYEDLVSNGQQNHELEMQVKRAQLEAALSHKIACEEVARAAVVVQESVHSLCHKWEMTSQCLQKVAEVFLQQKQSSNNYFDTNMKD